MPTRRRTDLTNLLEAVDDLLVHAGIIADDHYGIVEAHDGSRCFVDKDNPRTEITITRIIDPAREAQMRLEDLQ
jgi:Holliday junction resolvase RusA-like endonuclease